MDYGPYLDTLRNWEKIWAMKPKKVARHGRGFIRADHRIGDERYHLLITDPLEIALLEFCQNRLWTKQLMFVTPRECVALVTLKPNTPTERIEVPVLVQTKRVDIAS